MQLPQETEPIKFGRYTAFKLIGAGAMGKVYLADDPVLKRKVAIKVISLDARIDEATRREYLARFTIEAESSAKLHHPSIVAVYDAGQQDGMPWIAFQYVDGLTLDRLIRREGPLLPKRTMYIALDIASALQHAHALDVVHRDIKPSNILIENHSGVAMLMDFGVAKVPWSTLTSENKVLGSPGYMSPEQIDGSMIDGCSDIFSLGIVLYEAVTGKNPFARDTVQATMYATLSGKYTPLSEIDQRIPTQLETLVSMCLKRNPDRRIKAERIVNVLQSVLRIDDPAATRPIFRKGGLFILWPTVTAAIRRPAKKLMSASCAAITLYKRIEPSIDPLLKPAKAMSKALARRFSFICGKKTVISAAVFAAALLILGVLISKSGGHGKELYIPYAGLNRTGKSLIKAFHNKFAAGDLDSAVRCAAALTDMRGGATRGLFLRAVVECREEDYDEALGTFDEAAQLPGAKKLFSRNRDYMIKKLMPTLEKDRADEYLVNLLAHQFHAAGHRLIREAVKDTRYWLRWNAVRICEAADCSVDMVEVYMLDLEYAGSMQTRIKAVKKLGELGDHRAIPALMNARGKGLTDPFVSVAATEVLSAVFGQ